MAYYFNQIIAPKLAKRLNPKEPTTTNTLVSVDYDSIIEPLKAYGKDPLEFFRTIKDHLKDQDLNIIDFVVYSNLLNEEQASFFQALGIQIRRASKDGKSTIDLDLTVDALRVLYKNPNIYIFIIISSDRDITPLLKTIKWENKVSHVVTTRNGFNQQVAEYAHSHEYIDEILISEMLQHSKQQDEVETSIDLANVKEEDIERAKEVTKHFYNSHIWQRSKRSTKKIPINLNGFIIEISRVLNRFAGDILNDLKVAHQLKFVTIYQDKDHCLYLKKGGRVEDMWKH